MSKSWERPWSVEEIVENAGNWSLAGDAGLLKCMEKLSEQILSQSKTTIENVDKMMDNLNTASINLDLVKNEFFSLQNTQFIESRIYEDDEVLNSTVEEKVIDKSANEEEKKNSINKAILKGLEILDKYYDKVSINESDSEDDEEYTGSFMLKPKDPYLHRPLPYVIGSEEWHKKYHVGLEESSSDSEVEKVEETYSESDSDENLPITDRRKVSNSDSSTDISGPFLKPAANSTLAETMVSTDSEDNNGSISAQLPISNTTFANELSNRLGNIKQNVPENPVLEVNKKPLQKEQTHSNILGDFISDQPPPLSDTDDGIFDGEKSQGMFSGGGGLFDDSDDEDESIWNTKAPQKSIPTQEEKQTKVPNLFDDDNIFEAPVLKSNISQKPQKTTIGGLFDDDLEDDLFNSAVSKTETSKYKFDNKYVPSFIPNEPPELIVEKKTTEEIKPTLDKDATNTKLGAFLPKRRQSSSDSSSNEEIKSPIKSTTEPDIKSTGLFSDSEDLYKDDLFANIDKQITKSSFHNDEVDKSVKTNTNDNINKTINFFDDEEESDDLFSEANLSQVKSNSANLKNDDNLTKIISEVNEEVTSKIITSEDVKINQNPPKLMSSEVDHSLSLGDKKSKNTNLFDDSSDDDLFTSTVTPNKSSEIQQLTSQDFNFYNILPPELDDWDTKSENNLFDDVDDVFESNPSTLKIKEVSLFDKEPPSLDFNTPFENTQGISKSNIPKLFDTEASNLDVNFESPKPKTRPNLPEKPLLKNDNLFTDVLGDVNEEIFIIKTDNTPDLINEYEYIKENIIINSESEDGGRISIKHDSGLKIDKDNKENFMEDAISEKVVNTEDHQVAQPKGVEESVFKRASPGKIKHNLKINVAALMPGSSFTKKKDLQPSNKISKEDPNIMNDNLKDISDENEEENNNKANSSTEILYNVNKFRARGSQRRRPSTRRARQEFLKKSLEDEITHDTASFNNTNDNAPSTDKESISSNQIFEQKPVKIKPIQINDNQPIIEKEIQKNTNIGDIFENNEGQLDSFTNKLESNPNKIDLFDDLYDDSDIFNTNKVQPKSDSNFNPNISTTKTTDKAPASLPLPQKSSKTINLFDDDEDVEDNIFAGLSKTKPSSSIFAEEITNKKVIGKKGSLFGDVSDDDDMFTSGISVKKEIKSRNIVSKIKKVKTNSEVLEDPLDALSK